MQATALADVQLPFSLDAEQSVLGAVLLDNAAISAALEKLKPDCFYNEQNKELFAIIIRLFTAGTRADIITVLNEAVRMGTFETPAEGKAYLAALMSAVPSVSNIESYCKIVAEKFYIRSLITVSKEIIALASDGGQGAQELLDLAEQRIFDIRQGKDVKGLTALEDVIYEAYDRLSKISGADKDKYLGIRSGFTGLDALTTGLNRSDLILIAARPGMGKTSFAMNIALSVAKKKDKAVAVFSLEMSKEQLATRLLSTEALVDSNRLRSGKLTVDDWIRLAEAAGGLCKIPMFIDDTAAITVQQIKAKLRRLNNLGLVVIDYLQLMGTALKTDNRVVVISEITRQLKIMAKELNVPVIVLSQLSRAVESRADKRPMLSDLRESGSIEQDADIVLFLYREAYYPDSNAENINLAECLVSKNRHGETGSVKLMWDGQFTRFTNYEPREN